MRALLKDPPAMAKASALMALVGLLTVLLSDLLLRARGLDHVHGIDAHSYDITGSIVMMIALWGFVVSVRADRRRKDPVVTRYICLDHDGGQAAEAVEDALDHLAIVHGTYLGKVHMTTQRGPKTIVRLTGPTSCLDRIAKWFIAYLHDSNYAQLPMEVLND